MENVGQKNAVNAVRLHYLTGLKGIACLIVMLNHFLGAFTDITPWKEKVFCLFFNGSYMVNLFVILSCFFMAYSFFQNRKKLGKDILTRYFRLAIPLTVVMLLICVLQHIGAYQFDRILSITNSQRKESDKLNYYTAYSPWEAVKTALTCMFSGTTKFTFPIWMLPTLFKANMFTALICLAVEKCKTSVKLIIFAAPYVLITRYAGSMTAGCVIGVALAVLYLEYYLQADQKALSPKIVKICKLGGGGNYCRLDWHLLPWK